MARAWGLAHYVTQWVWAREGGRDTETVIEQRAVGTMEHLGAQKWSAAKLVGT